MKRPSVAWYAKTILNRSLYWYQQEVAEAILDSVLSNRGLTISVMMARQMGKNEISAIIEAYILSCMKNGNMVKAAPTYKPQTINSRLRLLSMLENPLTSNRIWRSYGYMIGVAPNPQQRKDQIGPRVMFFSASSDSSIVGATASLLLEIDEAQDVATDKYDRDLRPMASTTNATTVLYGTAWSDDTLLAIVRANNLELEKQDGIKRHFEYDWRTLASINPHYKQFVEAEIARLGEDHPTIRTQYCLQPISGAGFLLSDLQRYLLRGSHDWEDEPDESSTYIGGMDVGGEERPKEGQENRAQGRDSTIITIGKVTYSDVMLPSIEIVHQYWWTGKDYLEQYAQTVAICEMWGIRKLVIDRTGLGEVMGSLLASKMGDERVQQFHFTRPSKSKLTFQFLGMINSGRLKMYQQDGAPGEIYGEAWKQLKRARYSIPGQDLMDMRVDPHDGHDDFLLSIALCCEAIREWSAPAMESHVIRPRALYDGERY